MQDIYSTIILSHVQQIEKGMSKTACETNSVFEGKNGQEFFKIAALGT